MPDPPEQTDPSTTSTSTALAAVPPDAADAPADAVDKKSLQAHRRAVTAILSGALRPTDPAGRAAGDGSDVDEAPFFIESRREGFGKEGAVAFKDVYPEYLAPVGLPVGMAADSVTAGHWRHTLESGNNLTAFVAKVDVNTLGLGPYLSTGAAAAHAGLKPTLEDENEHPLVGIDRRDAYYAAKPCRVTNVKELERHLSHRGCWMSGRNHDPPAGTPTDMEEYMRLKPLGFSDKFYTEIIDRSEADVLTGLLLARALTRDSAAGPAWGSGAVKLLFDTSSKTNLRASVGASLALLYASPVDAFLDKKGEAYALDSEREPDDRVGTGDGPDDPMPQPVFRLYIEPDASEGAPRMNDCVNGFHWRQRLYALPPAAFRALTDELKRYDLLDEFPMLARLVGTRDKHYLDLENQTVERLKEAARVAQAEKFMPPLATYSPAGVKKIEHDPNADELAPDAAWTSMCDSLREPYAFRNAWVRRRTAWQPHGVRYLTLEGARYCADAPALAHSCEPDDPWLVNDSTYHNGLLDERKLKLPEFVGRTWGELRSMQWPNCDGHAIAREAMKDTLVDGEAWSLDNTNGTAGDDDKVPTLFRYRTVQLRKGFPEELNGRTLPLLPAAGTRLHDFVQWAADNWLRQSASSQPGRVVFSEGGLSPYPANLKHLQGLLAQRTEQRDRFKRNAEELTGELAEVRKRLCTGQTDLKRMTEKAHARETALRLGQASEGQPRHATVYFSGDLCQLRVLGRGGKLVARHDNGGTIAIKPDAANGVSQFAICFLPDLPEPAQLLGAGGGGAADPWVEQQQARDGSDSEHEDD